MVPKPSFREQLGSSHLKSKGAVTSDGQSDSQREWGLAQLTQLLNDCRHETNKASDSEPCRFCGNICTTWKQLTVHLGKHMEQLAMPVLELAKRSTASPSETPPIETTSGAPGAHCLPADSTLPLCDPHALAGAPAYLGQSQYPANTTHHSVNPDQSYHIPPRDYPSISGTILSTEPESMMDSFHLSEQFSEYGMRPMNPAMIPPQVQAHHLHQNSVTYPPYKALHRPRTAEANLPISIVQPSYSQYDLQCSSLYPAQAGYPTYHSTTSDTSYSSVPFTTSSSYSSQM